MMFQKMQMTACTQKVLSARSQSVAGRLMLALADERFLERNCPSFLPFFQCVTAIFYYS
jgi:hypothetical protein